MRGASAPTNVLTVILSRHGVRTPFSPTGGDLAPESLKGYSTRWKEIPTSAEAWGADQVEGQPLTQHGKAAITRMGAWYATSSRYEQLLSGAQCDDVFIYADNATRDVQTSEQFLLGLMPACVGHIKPRSELEYVGDLFNQGAYEHGTCTSASREQLDSLLGGSSDSYIAYNTAHETLVADMQSIVDCCPDASLCAEPTAGPNAAAEDNNTCILQRIPTEWIGEYWAAISGPTGTAGYFSSFFTLMALNNMSLALGERTLEQIVDLYQLSVDTINIVDNYWSAQSFTSELAAQILASLDQAATGTSHGLAHSKSTKLVFLAGHDTNLLLMANLLDLKWLTLGWRQNNPPPGGMLVFELHKNASSTFVRTFFEAATPDQIRHLQHFAADVAEPGRDPVQVPGCDSFDCPYDQFKAAVLHAIRDECVRDPALARFVNANSASSDGISLPLWITVLIVLGVVAVLGTVITRCTRKSTSSPSSGEAYADRGSTPAGQGDRSNYSMMDD